MKGNGHDLVKAEAEEKKSAFEQGWKGDIYP